MSALRVRGEIHVICYYFSVYLWEWGFWHLY